MFKKFNKVTWTSQSRSYSKTKIGVIICVLVPGMTPSNPGEEKGVSYYVPYHGDARDHESYIVRVGNKLYWPLVKNLQLVK
jgi:hypothetical protein